MGTFLSDDYDEFDDIEPVQVVYKSLGKMLGEEKEEDVAAWIVKGKDFVPAPDTKVTKELPSGAYKVCFEDSNWKMCSVSIKTDELYSFSEDFTTTILNEVTEFWKKEDVYKKYNLTHKRGILLCGAPGTGKTSVISLLIKQIIENNGLVFLVSELPDFNCLANTLKSIVRRIEPTRPIITVIEDVDQLIDNLGGDAKILDFLDGRNSIDNHLVILTSNNTTELSDALLRPSRIDLIYEIPSPDDRIRGEYFEKKGVKKEEIEEFVKATEGMSFAELKEIFVGTYVLGKPLEKVIQQVETPFECKDYLAKPKEMKGLI